MITIKSIVATLILIIILIMNWNNIAELRIISVCLLVGCVLLDILLRREKKK